MKIMLLSDANSPHTIKWVKGLAKEGVMVGLWSISKPKEGIYENVNNLKIFFTHITQERFGLFAKLKYLTVLSNLKSSIQEFQPDLLHAHFASSYGLLGALTKFKPYIISVWGNDVYLFPKQNFISRNILKYNLRSADIILSTSRVMAIETSKYTNKKIEITPFGIDLKIFKNTNNIQEFKGFTIGAIKTLEEKYGIGYLIDAFKIFHDKYPLENKQLLIIGSGSLDQKLKEKVIHLDISHLCLFLGQVPYEMVPYYHNKLDVCICLSIEDSESFGVSAIEASATERPVIVSNVGGLPEVIKDQVTGIVVPPQDAFAAANAIEFLFLNPDRRLGMGKEGRKRVMELYDWEDNLQQMIKIYRNFLKLINGK